MRYYGLDLRVEVDRMGARRLWVLIKGLPDDSAVWRQDKPKWTQQDELLASVAEVVAAAEQRSTYWLQILAAGLGRVYSDMKPPREPPPPLLARFEHPDRPTPVPAPGEGATADRDLPPVMTEDIARAAGFL